VAPAGWIKQVLQFGFKVGRKPYIVQQGIPFVEQDIYRAKALRLFC
jgi:hypothetical protein